MWFTVWSLPSFAGFLDMPDTQEVPLYQEETILLDLDIPNVRDRAPDPEGGPRLNVKEFRVQGIVEFPELGITREELAKKVEEMRFSIMREGDLLEGGYRLDELTQLADLVRTIEEDTKDRHVTQLEAQKIVFLVREQMRKRGVTLDMIENVALEISNFYRERGFILAKAFIPEQKVRDGVVNLTLLLGELGEVNVEKSKRYKSRTISRVFDKNIHKPVTKKEIEEGLFLVNDLPGLKSQGFFEPGQQVGDTRFNIDILEEQLYSGNIRLDNHGSTSTGEYRAYLDLFVYNPFGLADQFQIGMLNSFEPDNTTYGLFRYTSQILGPRWRFSTGISNNDFVSTSILSGATLDATGESLVSDISLGYFFKRSRTRNFSLSLSYTNIQTELTIAQLPQPDTEVNNTRLGFSFDVLNERTRSLHIGNIGVVASDSTEKVKQIEGTVDVNNDYSQLVLDYSLLKFLKFPFSKAETRLLFEVNGQYAGERQQSVNQFALTGPTRVRGFDVNQFFGDDGLRIGAEWVFKLPRIMDFKIGAGQLGRALQPYIAADASYGVAHPFESSTSAQEEKVTARFSSVGFGLKLNFMKNWKGDLVVSSPLTEKVDSKDEKTGEGTNVYFSFQYGF